jgi:hypothetical protein
MTTPRNPPNAASFEAEKPLQTKAEQDAATCRDALMGLCPEGMRPMFGPMVDLALSQLANTDTLSSLAADLHSAIAPDGTPDLTQLIVVGRRFGLTDEMIADYQQALTAGATL